MYCFTLVFFGSPPLDHHNVYFNIKIKTHTAMLTFTYVPESVSINVSYKEVINYFCYSTLHVFWTLTFS